MKSALGLVLGLLVLPYSSAFIPGPAGNPNDQPYAGQSGSAYDSTATPPRTDGVVTYNPNAPLPQTANASPPASGSMPAPPRAP